MLKKILLLLLILFPSNDFCILKTSKINPRKAKIALGATFVTGLIAGLHYKYPRIYPFLKSKVFERTWQEELRYMLTPPRGNISIEEYIWQLEGLPSKVSKAIVSGKLKQISVQTIAKIRPEFFNILLDYIPWSAKRGGISENLTQEQVQALPNGWLNYVSNTTISPASRWSPLDPNWPHWLTNSQMKTLANDGWIKRFTRFLADAPKQQNRIPDTINLNDTWSSIIEQPRPQAMPKKHIKEQQASQFIEYLKEKDKQSGIKNTLKQIVLPFVQAHYHGLQNKAKEFYTKYPEAKSEVSKWLLSDTDLHMTPPNSVFSGHTNWYFENKIRQYLLIDFLDPDSIPTLNAQQLKKLEKFNLTILLPEQLARLSVNQLQELAKNGWLFRQLMDSGYLLAHFTEGQLKLVFESYNIFALKDWAEYAHYSPTKSFLPNVPEEHNLAFKLQLNDRTQKLWEQFEKKFNVLQIATNMLKDKTLITITKEQMKTLEFKKPHDDSKLEKAQIVVQYFLDAMSRTHSYEGGDSKMIKQYLQSLDDKILNSEKTYRTQDIINVAKFFMADTFYRIIKQNYNQI